MEHFTVFLDIDDLEEDMSSVPIQNTEHGQGEDQSTPSDSQIVTLTTVEHERLLERLRLAEERACLSEDNLQRALKDLENVR